MRFLFIFLVLLWSLLWCDWVAWYQLPIWGQWLGFTGFAAGAWFGYRKNSTEPGLRRSVASTVLFVTGSQWLVITVRELAALRIQIGEEKGIAMPGGLGRMLQSLSVVLGYLALAGVFLIGLAWVVRFVDTRAARLQLSGPQPENKRVLNPLNLAACFYRKAYRKLDQSLFTFLSYTAMFLLSFFLLTNLAGCREIYEMPAGGGEQKQKQVVKIQKIIEKKIVINPFSSIIFNPPDIEHVKLELQEVTKHAYEVGYGAGEGAGFAGGTNRGKVRFIRIEYPGGDWDQDFGVGADLNMLLEYGIRTGHKVHDRTESRRISELKNFPVGKSPPFLYMTGQRNIAVSNHDVEVLREYLIDKHGMLFGDNGGSGGWHGQFFALMQKVLPTVKAVRVPLDHPIHTTPYQIPFLPYVAPHGGKDAWGWVVNGRLVAYYHPGDIGDAWADGHAGVKRQIWEHCYELGTNVIFYAHVEYNKWLDSVNEEKNGEKSARE